MTEAEIRSAALVIAMKEQEHRPIVRERFPSLVEHVEFWHVHDLDVVPASEALPLMELNVRALISRLQGQAVRLHH